MSSDITPSMFRSEYEEELESWLRRRLRYLCIAYLIFGAVVGGYDLIVIVASLSGGSASSDWQALTNSLIKSALYLAIVGYFFFARKLDGASRSEIIRAASRMILLLGAVSLSSQVILTRIDPAANVNLVLPLFFWHLTACAFLPWTPRESVRPIVPLMIAWALCVIWLQFNLDSYGWFLKIVFSPLLLLPGLAICAVRLQRHGEQFKSRMIGQHFLTMRQEIARAKTIHESMFPSRHDDGHVRFEYAYAPMREIGGDYVHVHVGAEGLLHLTLLDVTGHGLAAALTVNRLFGELERIRAESALARPEEVLTLLNRYIYFTMSRHNIYATAICTTVDPYLGQLHWANAGHPPAYLRGANGVVTSMPATTVLLGAMPPDEFDGAGRSFALTPGDVIVLYTDGAFEARNRQGRQFSLAKLRDLMSVHPAPRNWPQYLTAAVNKHTAGRNEDDILIASLQFLAHREQPARQRAAVVAR